MNVFVTNPQQSYCTQAKRYESHETRAECYLDFEIEDNLVGQLTIALAERESYKKNSPTFLRLGAELIFCWKFITDYNPYKGLASYCKAETTFTFHLSIINT